MSIGPAGITAGAAGSPLAQTAGPEADRVAQQLNIMRRRVYHGRKAEAAAGVAEPDGEDHESADRDANGRQPVDVPPGREANASVSSPKSKDHRRECGNLLDLTG